MHGVPCNIHGLPALFLGIAQDNEDRVHAVYTTLDNPSMHLGMVHPSHVHFVRVEAVPVPETVSPLSVKIRLIKLLREAAEVAAKEGNTNDNGVPRLSLSTAKRMAESFLGE